MALRTGSQVAKDIVDGLGDSNTLSLAAWTVVCNVLIAAVKEGTVVADSLPTGMSVLVNGAPVAVLGTGKIT